MYARSTTIHGDPMMIDAGIAHVRDEVMPAIQQMAGNVGLSMLCDRVTGRCIVTTAWRDEMSMHDTEGAFHRMRKRAMEILGGRVEVQEWEIALLHRIHEAHYGACTRVIWGATDPERYDDDLSTFRMNLLPRMADLPGFCSISLMINRDIGQSATAVTYDSRADMLQAAEMATAMREEFVRTIGMEITDMAEFDLVLAHLRVPETV